MTIFASGMNIGEPLIEKWNRSTQSEKLLGILPQEQKALNRHVEFFNGQT